eukprot:GHRR01016075.1.p1 GENE.GHRR01016075.1~~GHRR01016075.1.p1  ORF type:complete len:163 (+),score=48.14 GHRR01016075.1:268-756(+)
MSIICSFTHPGRQLSAIFDIMTRQQALHCRCMLWHQQPVAAYFAVISTLLCLVLDAAAVADAIQTGKGFVESAANLVPESVPRPVAKGGVAVAGVILAFWVLQKLVSTVLTIALLGGAAWFYFQYGGGNGSAGAAGSSSKGSDASLDDPLAEARRIMDKYKK